ncbi:MAG: flippase-like domain-containing protein [Gemmatimonadaceae bacterium]|nr:flippase-like domain-containing protein [Gemmatimonadaceae bacterium]
MRRRAFLLGQWLLAAAIVWYAIRALQGQWRNAAARLGSLDPQWTVIGASAVIVLLTYVLLIDAWRQVVTASGDRLSFGTAARIWFVSNLGKYVPGKVWSIAAMTMMARQSSVSPVVAAGSSVLMQVVSIVTGIGVVLVTGAQALDRPRLAILAAAFLSLLLLAMPRMMPSAAGYIARIAGREIVVPPLATSTVLLAALRSAISWIAYGVAFKLFVRGLLGTAAGATTSYIAVYAASYIIGFLALFAPGGAVVRESAMVTGMLRLGLAGQVDAVAIAVASRLWLTVLELLPGFGYLAASRRSSLPRT